jgi:hypothetical protein
MPSIACQTLFNFYGFDCNERAADYGKRIEKEYLAIKR